ncbi:penicillin-binding protein activator [Jejubacter calystegiae]|uniref:Penicillin-binding protein activator LpoA n=1 Tax=Jejubacter calystegiae TaxID=2579935 RepID=A0A4P8YMC2_9ENTR|nr:penicillin-binding protein activator [Jejubacter calystegiae]QCT19662.1 penicillin-binding protein activator [Jejubacter calystegiae]
MVPSKLVRSKAGRCLPVVLAALFFAGCGTQAPEKNTALLQGDAKANSAFYLQQMQQNADNNKTTWQLLAVRALLQEGKTSQATELWKQVPTELTDAQRQEYTLLSAQVKIAAKDYKGATSALDQLDVEQLPASQQARYWQARIDASQGRPSLDLLRALVAQEPLLKGDAKQKNIDATWQALSAMTQEQARALVINADENTLQGWLDLQQVWFTNRRDPKMMQSAIKDWQTRYPQNPAATQLPTALSNAQNYKPASTDKIALLLPLNGQAAVFGRAIQQGFEAAKNAGVSPALPPQSQPAPQDAPDAAPNADQPAQASDADSQQEAASNNDVASPSSAPVDDLTGERSQTPQPQLDSAQQTEEQAPQAPQQQTDAAAATPPQATTAPARPQANIQVYDTSSQPIEQILAQAQRDGASLVVGPLLKNNVNKLASSNSPLNILALNQPENVTPTANICYFALSPEDEARDAANHIWQQGKRAPLLLVPYSALGDRVSKAFVDQWQSLGGGTVLQQKFGSVGELRQKINGGSGIALTGTPVNGSQPADSVTSTPSPVTDSAAGQNSGGVDSAWIMASRNEISLIKPLIAMRTGSHSGVQLYASSRSAQAGSGADFRLEMEGLQFSEISMLAGDNPGLMQQALSASNGDYSLARLYAMGVDAWTIANNFSQMRQQPGYQVNGNTGTLSATPDCVIGRKMVWLRYQQGRIVPAGY